MVSNRLFSVILLTASVAVRSGSEIPFSAAQQRAGREGLSMNPDISAMVDVFFHMDDTDEGIAHVMEEMAGFGHIHDGGHGHALGPDEGFNLRHVELSFGAAVDPYFRALAIAAIDLDGAEIEVAEIETTGLPAGLKLKAGKFCSEFSHHNPKHAHQWDFTDQPLIYKLALGDHGLNDIGAQISWLAPAPVFVMLGAEAFQGDNERAFAYHGEAPLPDEQGPRVAVGWLKVAPNLPGRHGMIMGAAVGTGTHQEEHDGDDDGEQDHILSGDSAFWGAHLVYKYNSPKPYGEGDFTFQCEYFRRSQDLDLVAHDLRPDLVGNSLEKNQDGCFIQAVYGVLPRWRLGARWEQVGWVNDITKPGGETEEYDTSDRISAMIDFSPTEYSRLRFQVNHGSYATEDGRERGWEGYIQLMVSLGAHGAHAF